MLRNLSRYQIYLESKRQFYLSFFSIIIHSFTFQDSSWNPPVEIIGNFKNDVAEFYFVIKDKLNLEKFLDIFVKNPSEIKKLEKFISKVHRVTIKKISHPNFKKLSNEQLGNLILYFYGQIEKFNYAAAIIRAIDRQIYSRLKNIFKKKKDSDELIRLISVSNRLSLTLKEEIDILKLAMKIKDKSFSSKKVQKEIDKIYQDHCWSTCSYYKEKPKTRYHYAKTLKSLIKKNPELLLKKIMDKITNELYERERILDNLKKDEKIIAEITSSSAFLKDYARMFVNKLIFKSEPLFEEIARRTNKKIEYIKNLLPEEIKRLINGLPNDKNLIKERLKHNICLVHKGELFLLVGKEAKEFEKKYIEKDVKEMKELKGRIACKGYGIGKAKIVLGVNDFKKFKKGDILVASNTSPDFVPIMKKAVAIVAEEGGITTHVSVISRELNIPCVVGIKDVTKIIKDNEMIEVDANKGVIKKVNS
ncbi:MAG: hypothetical protein KKF89_05585 [Nanoarchaeota archaeon]|nr:hypothetical protein [Nanoarchaeota archaeon]